MRFTAQYPGMCIACDGPIAPGQTIERLPAPPAPTFPSVILYRHAPACPETAAERADREALAAGRCPRCGLNHRGDC